MRPNVPSRERSERARRPEIAALASARHRGQPKAMQIVRGLQPFDILEKAAEPSIERNALPFHRCHTEK